MSTRRSSTKFEYAFDTDPLANEVVTKITLDFGTGRKNLVTEYGYNAWGDITSAKDPRGNVSTATSDYKRRTTQAQSAAPFNFVSKLTFDKNDNLVKSERQTGVPAAPWQTSEATHDIDGKLLTTKDPLNIVTTRQYDQLNRLWKFTDGENRTTERLYDERSQVETVIEPGNHVVETNTYGPSGELLSITDEKSFVVQFTVDGFNRPSKVIYPNGTFEQIVSYDANGNALSTLSRAGDATTFSFDALNRPLTKAATGKPVVSYSYDLSGRITTVSTPVQGGNPDSGVFQYFYDSAGRGIGEQLPDGKSLSYVLDQNGNVVRVVYADNYFVDRVFDQLNRLTDIKLNGATTAAAHFSYNDLSNRTQLSFNNGTLANYEYQANDRLSKIDQQFVGSTVKFDYSYNQAHEAVVSSASSSQLIWTPSLDKTTAYGAVTNLNQYPTVDAQPLSYNANGCLTSDGAWTFAYDSENQLLSAAKGTDLAQFAHDPMNRQTQKDFNSAKTRFVYSGWQRLADYDGTSGSLQKRYVYGTGLDEPLFEISPAGVITKYFHRDRLGSVVALTDNAGAVTNRYSYSPFGEANDMTGTTFGYTGQRADSEIGLWFYKRRYYSAKLGRFLQPDPITSFGNLYAYCSNDPINFIDPLGEFPVQHGHVENQGAVATQLTLADVIAAQNAANALQQDQFREEHRRQQKKKKCVESGLCKADAAKLAAQSLAASGNEMYWGLVLNAALDLSSAVSGLLGAGAAVAGETVAAVPAAGRVVNQAAVRAGNAFHKFVYDLTGIAKNGTKVRPSGRVASVPDAIQDFATGNGVTEFKHVKSLSLDAQLRSMVDFAKSLNGGQGVPFDLIVSEKLAIEKITQPLIDAVLKSGGNIIQVNSKTGLAKILF